MFGNLLQAELTGNCGAEYSGRSGRMGSIEKDYK